MPNADHGNLSVEIPVDLRISNIRAPHENSLTQAAKKFSHLLSVTFFLFLCFISYQILGRIDLPILDDPLLQFIGFAAISTFAVNFFLFLLNRFEKIVEKVFLGGLKAELSDKVLHDSENIQIDFVRGRNPKYINLVCFCFHRGSGNQSSIKLEALLYHVTSGKIDALKKVDIQQKYESELVEIDCSMIDCQLDFPWKSPSLFPEDLKIKFINSHFENDFPQGMSGLSFKEEDSVSCFDGKVLLDRGTCTFSGTSLNKIAQAIEQQRKDDLARLTNEGGWLARHLSDVLPADLNHDAVREHLGDSSNYPPGQLTVDQVQDALRQFLDNNGMNIEGMNIET
ncbi:hypothetical protein [Halomicronema sp. CCY15110]|uniref:hypothetical protein n=1 Tax=Halomicronema sp. CCY15110 TaxID=2767773 RepID=UPI001951004D|nr:hypothetical protein [Halomicronema sp. CCY15110]